MQHSVDRFSKTILPVLMLASVLFAGCHPTPGPEKTLAGTLLGAGWGAGAGAVVGNQTNNTPAGAAIGAGFGAASGFIAGATLDLAEENEVRQHRELEELNYQVSKNRKALARLRDEFDYQVSGSTTEKSQLVIYFDASRASLRVGSATQLERIAEAIKRDPHARRIEIHGHSENTGSAETNRRLAEARARTVFTFLATHGISVDRMETFEHGASEPLASNDSSEGRHLNRRVEIVVKE